jgi:diacylglycerol kinase (ATP)
MVMTENQQGENPTPLESAKPPPRNGFQRLGPAIKHSVAGLQSTWRTESAFRQEVVAFIIMFPMALWLGDTNTERLLLIVPLFLVLIVELMNTAVEALVDRWGFEFNDLAKVAKDAGSAAVFISLILTGFIWLMIIFG